MIGFMVLRFVAYRLLLSLLLTGVLGGNVHAATLSAGCPVNEQPCNGRCIPETSLCILEPLPNPGGVVTDEIPAGGPPLSAFFRYINTGVWQWAFKIGVAIAVLNGTIGGFQIVLSNGDSGKVDLGKKRFLGSAIGLIILLLSGVILEFLNPLGFDAI